METYELHFSGYYSELFTPIVTPRGPGIYCIYICKAEEGLLHPFPVPSQLFYIGRADSLRKRLLDPEHEALRAARALTNTLQFRSKRAGSKERHLVGISYATVERSQLERIEAAMVYHLKPTGNQSGKLSFNHPATEVVTTGKNILLGERFQVGSGTLSRLAVLSLLYGFDVFPSRPGK